MLLRDKKICGVVLGLMWSWLSFFSPATGFHVPQCMRVVEEGMRQGIRFIPASLRGVSLMSKAHASEMLDVLDENGVPTDQALGRFEVHQKGLWHRAVHLYLLDSKLNKIFLQKRSPHVDHYANLWIISLTGHVDTPGKTRQLLSKKN